MQKTQSYQNITQQTNNLLKAVIGQLFLHIAFDYKHLPHKESVHERSLKFCLFTVLNIYQFTSSLILCILKPLIF